MKQENLAQLISTAFFEGHEPSPDDVLAWGEPDDVPEERPWKSIRIDDFRDDAFFIVDCTEVYRVRVFGLGLLLSLNAKQFDLEAYRYFLRPIKSGTVAAITSTSQALIALLNNRQREIFLEFCAFAAVHAEGTTKDYWASLLGPSKKAT